MEITNITTLVEALESLGKPKEGHARFFRGHSRLSHHLEPSIYRMDERNSPDEPAYLIKNEDQIIREALTSCPDSFSPNDTLFEKLVKLQHYGYATRLLDLTTNALVALYFAVKSGANGENGELIVLDIPDTEIKYHDSDVVSILSAISLRKENFTIKAYLSYADNIAKVERTRFYLHRLEKHELIKHLEIPKFFSTFLEERLHIPMEKAIEIEANNLYDQVFIERFNTQPDIARLLHDIRHDKPSFAPIIKADDFNRLVCVRAKLNNPRIIRQQGCFLLFGINNEKLIKAEVAQSWKRTLSGEADSDDENKLIIKDDAKGKILEELKSFGISHQNLFPELDAQARDIMAKYRCV